MIETVKWADGGSGLGNSALTEQDGQLGQLGSWEIMPPPEGLPPGLPDCPFIKLRSVPLFLPGVLIWICLRRQRAHVRNNSKGARTLGILRCILDHDESVERIN